MHKLPLKQFILSIIFISTLFSSTSPLWAVENVAYKLLPGVQKIGAGHYSYLGWSIYDAALYNRRKPVGYDKPFALTLHYHLTAKGQQIAARSLDAIRQQGIRDEYRLATWYRQMRRIFPDVQKGTRLTGVYFPDKGVWFYLGETEIGAIQDPKFAVLFFNIWLAKETPLKALRQKLLGMK